MSAVLRGLLMDTSDNKRLAGIHEDLLIRSLVSDDYKERAKSLLCSQKGRKKFRNKLAHFSSFESRWVRDLATNEQSSRVIVDLLLG